MTSPGLATVCVLTYGDFLPYFRRCLDSLLATTPLDAVELRLGFNQAPESCHYALGRLCPDGRTPCRTPLPGGLERFEVMTEAGRPVCFWQSPANLYKEPMARRLFYDVPLWPRIMSSGWMTTLTWKRAGGKPWPLCWRKRSTTWDSAGGSLICPARRT